MKKHQLLSAALICLLPSLSLAQAFEWENTIGGINNDGLYSINPTSDGGYILGGRSQSDISGDKSENSNGGDDYWMVKTDSAGVIQWQNTIGGSGNEILFSVEQTADGGYILGGHSNSNTSGDKIENCIGGDDYWIVKTDASGNIQWQNTIGGTDMDFLNVVHQTTDGGYILGGWSKSMTSGDKSEDSYYYDLWIVKTDASGNVQWQNTIGGVGNDRLRTVQQTTDGGYILGGFSNSNISIDKTENSQGGEDFWIVKTDGSGVIQWQNTIGGNLYDELYTIEQTTDGGYILGGRSESNLSGDKTENNNGFWDFWIVKTDTSGNIQWQNTIGGSSYDYFTSIQQTADGGYFLSGWSLSGISGDKTESNNGQDDFWILKTDAGGNIQWQNSIGGNGSDFLYCSTLSPDGKYILGGWSDSDISGDKSEINYGGFDYWIMMVSDHYNLITGKVFIDANSNNTQDFGETAVANHQITEINTGRFGYSGQNGYYIVSVPDPGSFSVSHALNYYTAVPVSHSANFTGIQQTDSLNDFAFQPAGVFNDLCVSITPTGPFRAGFNAGYLITYENVGTTTLNPTVIFYPDDDLSFVSAAPAANTVTTDSLVWNFGPLAPFQSGSILVTLNVNVSTPIGTLINSGTVIEPIAGDANTQCNQSFWEVFTTGSIDPNDILVNEDSLLTTQFPNPPYLEYIIRFQNTGNDTAFTVKVLNPIDTLKLELNTFEFVASSHPVNLTWLPWERNMQFQFDNILLPDSNVNEPASHGFIRYRIKPKSSLVLGDSITNNAAIYFDFNAPVITNTALTEIVLPTFISETTAPDNLLLYPNPAHSTLTIETGRLTKSGSQLIISDVTGRIIFTKSLPGIAAKHELDISSFSQGIYFVQLQAGENVSRGRFVKE